MMVVGAGNWFRRDDAAGLVAARQLRERLPRGVRVIEKEGDLASLLDAWTGSEAVVVLDATSSRSAPGTIRRFEAHERPLPAVFSRASTHALGVAEVVELARVLGRLPASLVVYGVEGRDFTPGAGLSPAVGRAVERLVRRVTDEAVCHD